MLECNSCLLRCLQAIAGDVLPGAAPALRAGLRNSRQNARVGHRGYATASVTYRQQYTPQAVGRSEESYREHRPTRNNGKRQDSHKQQDSAQVGRRRDGTDKEQHPVQHAEQRQDSFKKKYTFQDNAKGEVPSWRKEQEDRHKLQNRRRKVEPTNTDAITSANEAEYKSNLSPQMERAVKKELVYLKDPLKHANHVKQTLRENDLDKALALCRIASKDMQVIVSWNHTIDYLLARRELKLALKTYNEMKKRAQFPDSHTYVILLRGLATPPVHADTVGKAVSIYHSLAAPNSRVVQSIIHTNAALKVCSRGHDMDSMWGIASRIPDKGPGAADNYTFTTILNAIRETALAQADPAEGDDAAAQARQTAIQEGRRIWGDIAGKWRKGDLIVDEELACAMGRLLLVGLRPRDWDDVLSLVEQTMDIPRLAAKLGTPARKAELMKTPGKIPRVLKEDAQPNQEDEEIMSEFDKDLVKTPKRVGGGGSVAYVKPSNRSLSLIMEACLKMATPEVAHDYWNLLTAQDTYNIVPDMDNLSVFLRVLRQSRDSDRVIEVLRTDIMEKGIQPMRKIWRIAMSACSRDTANPQVVKNAGAIMDMMENNAPEMDIKAARIYLDLSLGTDDGKQISHAINRLGPVVRNLRSQLNYGSDRAASPSDPIKEEALLLFRTIIGSIDALMNKDLVPREDFVMWTQRRARLASYVMKVTSRISGKSSWNDADKVAMRKESRQLRNFRRNAVRRAKKDEGTWEASKKTGNDDKASKSTGMTEKFGKRNDQTGSAHLSDLPGEVNAL